MAIILQDEPAISDYWVRWDPDRQIWEASIDKGVTWYDLVENPTVQKMRGNPTAAPTPDAKRGFIYFDGTYWQVYEGLTGPTRLIPAAATVNAIEVHGGAIVDANGFSFTPPLWVYIWIAPYACTVTAVKGIRVGGTSAFVNVRSRGQNSLMENGPFELTSANGVISGVGLQNINLVAGDTLEIAVTAYTGTVTEVAVQIDLVRI